MKQVVDEITVFGDTAEDNAVASEEINASVEELTALMSNVGSNANMLLEKAESLNTSLQIFKF